MPRILGTQVPARFPDDGPIRVFLMGEAPGPRGADQSGIPFWGDRAGLLVYRALAQAGLAEVPEAAWGDWDGARFRELGLAPRLTGAALGNAFPCCPTSDGDSFRAPTDRELKDPGNLARLADELGRAAVRCRGPLRVIGMGRRAQWILERLEGLPPLDVQVLPHPSAQGLLQAAPDKGRGMKLAELQAAWRHRLEVLLRP
ncbi:MAG TPA: uracil-DNA glycosylase family protein [Holophagaceae bacterium]|nr:uracil-DNA glycosylase family protein [Holophagaceae bacterium]